MYKKSIFLFLLVLLICSSFASTVSAVAQTIKTFPIDDADKAAIISKANIQPIETASIMNGITCFDVSNSGEIAIGIDWASNSVIYVYDSQGVFQYGFSFYVDGDYGIAYCDNLLGIYCIRGDTIMFCDNSAACLDVRTLSSDELGYWQAKEILNRVSKEMGGKRYVLERDINIGDSYSRLVEIDEQGVRTVLYDATPEHNIGQILGLSAIIIFFLFVVWGCITKAKRNVSADS